MVKLFFPFVLASSALLSAAAADYFPVAEGNVWNFSYVSTSSPVVSNPPTTKDSGTINWKIYANTQTEESFTIGVKQTRSLLRRTLTQWGTPGYDSVFPQPRTTIDTVVIIQEFSGANNMSFAAATCPFAIHDPTIAMPPELSSKDTTISFQGTISDGKKMIVSACSCLKPRSLETDPSYSYSFTLVPAIGPVAASIGYCPGIEGSSFQETWKLIGRGFPTSVLRVKAPSAELETVIANQSSGRIYCSLNIGYSSPVHIDVFDVQGRLIKTVFTGYLDAGAYRYTWNIPVKTVGIVMLRVRTEAENRCIRIITGAQ